MRALPALLASTLLSPNLFAKASAMTLRPALCTQTKRSRFTLTSRLPQVVSDRNPAEKVGISGSYENRPFHPVFVVTGKVATKDESSGSALFKSVSRRSFIAGRDRDLSRNRAVMGFGPCLVPGLNRLVTEDEFVIDRVGISNDEANLVSAGKTQLTL
jgi:hypothetical protein